MCNKQHDDPFKDDSDDNDCVTIETNVPIDVQLILIREYVHSTLDRCSANLYDEMMDDFCSSKEALWQAILNNMIVKTLVDEASKILKNKQEVECLLNQLDDKQGE